ncbi:MAG: N-carbamoylputrescine amidase [Verrucomicrobia bacterium]|jgi:N-carbamoylputrescine amidase|nr:N-carbamoylputrescine amidase [Verrucomicrobiota bacterium]
MARTEASSPDIAVAAVQLNLYGGMEENLARAEAAVREAARKGAELILLPELFQGPYFCRAEKAEFFAQAYPLQQHAVVRRMQQLAAELQVVLPVSFFEREGNSYYNSIAMVERNGSLLGVYRKSHIPDGPGYEEKFYFRPGNTGFKVWDTSCGRIGVGVCWDQWFPECARAMVLEGADLLLYPTAIGSEPEEPELDTRRMWQRAMQGHAIANIVPIVACNRYGDEEGQVFYGHSFICDAYGEILREAPEDSDAILFERFHPDRIRLQRASMGFFRDRRPELYQRLVES